MKYCVIDVKRVNIRKTPAGATIGHAFLNEIFPFVHYIKGIPFYEIEYKGIHAYIPSHYVHIIEIKKDGA